MRKVVLSRHCILSAIVLVSCVKSETIYSKNLYNLSSDKLTYNSLTNEKNKPFQTYNRSVGIEKSIEKFKSTRDCLVAEEQQKESVDLRLIDWAKLKSQHDINVCLWRIFSSLDDINSVEEWFKFQGFEISTFETTSTVQSYDSNTYEAQTSLKPLYQLRGTYSTMDKAIQLHPYKSRKSPLRAIYGYNISTQWARETNTLMHVKFSSNIN